MVCLTVYVRFEIAIQRTECSVLGAEIFAVFQLTSRIGETWSRFETEKEDLGNLWVYFLNPFWPRDCYFGI